MTTFIAPDRWETDRFTLRSWLPGDGPLLYEAVASSRDHLAPFMPWVDGHTSAEASEALLRGMRARWLLGEDFGIPVFSPDGKRILGATGFHVRQGPIGSGNIEAGMWIRADEAGKGLGSALLAAVVEWAWAEWPWRRIVWKCDAHNVASRRTAESAGFALEGILVRDGRTPQGDLRDTCIYALLHEERASGLHIGSAQ